MNDSTSHFESRDETGTTGRNERVHRTELGERQVAERPCAGSARGFRVRRDAEGRLAVILLLFLILLPLAAWFWARRNRPARLWLITGSTFGAVVEPVSLGLYATMILPPLGVITGLIGFAASNFHALPGYEIATAVGLVEAHQVVGGIDHLWISGANALVWGSAYGALGCAIDRLRNRRSGKAVR